MTFDYLVWLIRHRLYVDHGIQCRRAVVEARGLPYVLDVYVDDDGGRMVECLKRVWQEYGFFGYLFNVQPLKPAYRYTTGFHLLDRYGSHRHRE